MPGIGIREYDLPQLEASQHLIQSGFVLKKRDERDVVHEIEELVGLCDRILVMSRGLIREEFHRSEFDRERILRAALHERGPSVIKS